MSVTGKDLIALGLDEGPELALALAEANRLNLAGPALETFARVLVGRRKAVAQNGQDYRGGC